MRLRKVFGVAPKGHPMEEEVPPHSGILAWEIPWTEEPRGLPGGHRETQPSK